jgi:D-alanine-D-alanine ligase
MNDKTLVAVILGGRSTENYRSCRAGSDVIEALLQKGYEVTAFGMTLEANWISFDDLNALKRTLKKDAFELTDETAKEIPSTTSSILPPMALLEIPVVFSTLMGAWGSDGTMQGMFETAIVRYVGSNTLGSAISSDKSTAKLLMESVEIPTPKHVVIPDKSWRRDPASNAMRAASLKTPLVSKPARGSNGVGITHIKVPRDFKNGVDIARNFDGRVIVEKYHEPVKLLECNIIEDTKRQPVLSEIIQTNWNEADKVFNFISRTDKSSYSFTKAKDIEPEVIELIHEYAKRTFEVLTLSGYAQIEFMIDKEGELLVLEVNCQPYLGKDGSFALSWKKSGIAYPDLIDQIVKEALERPVGLI